MELQNDVLVTEEFEQYELPKLETLLPVLEGNALALDIAKNHTGVCKWYNNQLSTIGFEISEYDNSDYHAEYRMRAEFKDKLQALIQNETYSYIIVEDVYGGENFDTIRKLLALQTVIDELIFDNVVQTEHFYRWKQPQWASRARMIYKQSGKLKSKIETQGLLEYLQFDFYLKYKDLTNPEKEAIFFEDICDACGMLVALVAEKTFNNDETAPQTLKTSDIVTKYVEDYNNLKCIKDKYILENDMFFVELDYRKLEKSIYNQVVENPTKILVADLPVSKLGHYGIKKKFKFFESGKGYLIFYDKRYKNNQ